MNHEQLRNFIHSAICARRFLPASAGSPSKYGFLASYTISLVSFHSITACLIYTFVALCLFLLSKLRLVLLWENTRALLVVIILLNYFQIELNGVAAAASMTLKMISLLLIVTIILSTTPPEKQLEGLRKLSFPLRRLGVKTESFTVMLTLAVIYFPLLWDDFMRIKQAQKLRGPQYGRWNLTGRGRDMILLLMPLIISIFRRAERLSDAMESRCFRPDGERTSFYRLKFGRNDFIVSILALMLPWIHFYSD